MLRHGRKQARQISLPLTSLSIDAQERFIQNNKSSSIVTCRVYYSVSDPIRGMNEMLRVCKPGRKILLLEHMRSDNPILGKAMDVINPIVVGTYGANINRRTIQNIERAGLKVENEVHLFGSVMRRLSLSPNK